VGAGAHDVEEVDDVLDVLVQAEASVLEPDVARVVPVADEDVVIAQQGANGGAQEGREVAGEGRGHEHPRLDDVRVLGEVQQRAERSRVADLLPYRYLVAGDAGRLDSERGTPM
jgi:hypothetical protein